MLGGDRLQLMRRFTAPSPDGDPRELFVWSFLAAWSLPLVWTWANGGPFTVLGIHAARSSLLWWAMQPCPAECGYAGLYMGQHFWNSPHCVPVQEAGPPEAKKVEVKRDRQLVRHDPCY